MIEDTIFYPVFALIVFTLSFLIVRRKLSQSQWAKKFTSQPTESNPKTVTESSSSQIPQQNREEKAKMEQMVAEAAALVTRKMATEKMDIELPKESINELLQRRDKLIKELTELRQAKLTKIGVANEELKIIDNTIEEIKSFQITEATTTASKPLMQNLDKELGSKNTSATIPTSPETPTKEDPTKTVRRKAKEKKKEGCE